jgi:hypothetical protein
VFIDSIHFLPSLMFMGKARKQPLEWSPTLVDTSFCYKYQTVVEVIGTARFNKCKQWFEYQLTLRHLVVKILIYF